MSVPGLRLPGRPCPRPGSHRLLTELEFSLEQISEMALQYLQQPGAWVPETLMDTDLGRPKGRKMRRS